MLFNIPYSYHHHTASLPFALATQYASLEVGADVLTTDPTLLANFFKNWKLCSRPIKTVISAFHLSNNLADKSFTLF